MSLENYDPVALRIDRFWKQYPNGRILTELVDLTGDRIIVKAEIYTDREDARPVASDFAMEIQGTSKVNQFFHLEAGVTSAIGRALATFNFQGDPSKVGADARPSREEMQKVQRTSGQSAAAPRQTQQGDRPQIANPDALASEKQIVTVRRMAHQLAKQITDHEIASMTKGRASELIGQFSAEIANAKARQEDQNLADAEEPF